MRQKLLILWLLLPALPLGTCPALAQADSDASDADPTTLFGIPVPPLPQDVPDKSGYWLLKPVPEDQMRSFSTDRPGKTHSSTTVDAGHFQVESDIAVYSYDHYAPSRQTSASLTLGAPIVKEGVTNWMDVEAGFAFYNQARVTDRATSSSTVGSGFGDVLLGSKMNIFGNEGGRQALAILPFVKIPSAASNVGNGVTEYNVNIPYAVQLDTLWSVTLEPQLNLLKNNNNDGLHGDYNFDINLNRPVFAKTVTAALELSSEYASGANITPRYTLDPSLQWLVLPDLQLDTGAYFGLNKAAPDMVFYSGISWRY